MPCAESRDGASFTTLFSPALFLGILSRRRVYFEALKYKKERDSGFLSPFGYSSATIASTVDSVCSMEVLYQLCENCIYVLIEVAFRRLT